jgi:hypothetical protein
MASMPSKLWISLPEAVGFERALRTDGTELVDEAGGTFRLLLGRRTGNWCLMWLPVGVVAAA